MEERCKEESVDDRDVEDAVSVLSVCLSCNCSFSASCAVAGGAHMPNALLSTRAKSSNMRETTIGNNSVPR